jgi:hypothetical protein
MRYGRRSIKRKNRDKKREGDAYKETERAIATCLESIVVIMEFEECN